ncbi:MAG: hypothetical protein LBD30_09170 [Verrucomicrobiales bacterium]|jgi:hypothetical protein|nr:hypothetical protein [Verrucomicrobiales bacterium]
MRFWSWVTVSVAGFCLNAWAEQPRVDFDFVLEALKNSGAWKENAAHKFDYQPKVAPGWAPYRHGQWRYTDYGWTWQGADNDSWITDHYGYWTKRDTVSGAWAWVPGAYWLPSTVEWLRSGDYLGWRASKLDRFSNPQESENIRYSDPSEWNFIPAEKIRAPLTVTDFAPLEKTKDLLVSAQPADHIFTSYREIERPGADPSILKPADRDLIIPNVTDLPALDAVPDRPAPRNYYLYRPKFFQDEDGIFRRVDLFLRPQTKEQQAAGLGGLTKADPEQQAGALRRQEELLEKQRRHEQELYR